MISRDPYQMKAELFNAMKNNDMNMMKKLLDAGADPNSYAGNGDPAVIAAVRKWNGYSFDPDPFLCCPPPNILKILIDAGADPNNVNKNDKLCRCALYWAAYELKINAVKTLILGGADVDKTDIRGKTAMLAAAERGVLFNGKENCLAIDIMVMLIEAGADINKRDERYVSAWDVLWNRSNQIAESNYKRFINAMPHIKRLRDEDSAGPGFTGFEFDI